MPRWKVDPELPTVAALSPAVAALAMGGVVAYPTETYYGLAADPRQPRALEAILELKGRTASKPLLLLVDSVDMALRFTEGGLVEPFDSLTKEFWPGPLTLILRPVPGLHEALTGGRRALALRLSPHPVARALVRECGVPLTATSANRGGEPPLSEPDRVEAAFGHGLAGLVDAGPTAGGVPSTLLDLTTRSPTILRRGAISAARIRAALRGIGADLHG